MHMRGPRPKAAKAWRSVGPNGDPSINRSGLKLKGSKMVRTECQNDVSAEYQDGEDGVPRYLSTECQDGEHGVPRRKGEHGVPRKRGHSTKIVMRDCPQKE